jgi:predicted Zn-dependent peptidase
MMRICVFLLLFPTFSTLVPAADWNTLLQKTNLENGITLIYEKDASSKITAVQIYIKGGKRAEPPEKSGLAYLTTRLTLEFPDQDKLRSIMNQATQIGFDCRNDYSYVAMICLSEKLEESLKIISQIMYKPLFSGLRINGVKKLMERMRDRKEDEPFNVAHQKFMETIFAETPYGHPPHGTKESLKATKKKDITGYFKTLYHGGNMVAVVSSDL